MSITHPAVVRNALADLVVDRIDVGAGLQGKIRVRSEANVTLVDLLLDIPPAFGSASAGLATSNNPPHQGTAVASDDADNFQVLDRDDAIVFEGDVTVTGGGGSMTLTSVQITINDLVKINVFTYEASP